MKLITKLALTWLIISSLFWVFYISAVEMMYQIMYYLFIVFLVGIPVWIYRDQIKTKLRNWKMNNFGKFLILGYATVLFEETFAALFNHLSEGFNLTLYIQRIGQFWLFNIFAFTGFYFAWYFLTRRYKYTYKEVFFTAGIFGLFAEGVIFSIGANPLAVFFLTPLMIVVYGLMITAPMLSVALPGKKKLNRWLKYVLSLIVIFLFSIIPILILITLRTNFPGLFPPAEFIPI